MKYRGYIDVTEIDPRLLVQAAFSGSRPQGRGFLHHRPGGLDEATLNEIIDRSQTERRKGEIHLDYLHGRSMKFNVRVDEETGKRYIDLDWYDHGREATKHLVRECGLPDVEARIVRAENEKAEEAREYEERQEKAARTFIAILLRMGGVASSNKPPFAEYYNLPEGDPVLEAWEYGRDKAVKNRWATVSQDWREYAVTEAGSAIPAIKAA